MLSSTLLMFVERSIFRSRGVSKRLNSHMFATVDIARVGG